MLCHATELLESHFGYDEFRPLQQRVLRPVLAGQDTLAVLPTGAGKSLCYQLPALLQPGATLVVSPLIALMQDQVATLAEHGIDAAMLGGTLGVDERRRHLDALAAGRCKLAFISPERLSTNVATMVRHGIEVSLLAVDEAHCIVEWGHDFRPAYREIGRARRVLGDPACLALTGSATPQVRHEIATSLHLADDAARIIGSFDRSNLRFKVIAVHSPGERFARLIAAVSAEPDAAIVYAPTRNLVEGIVRALRGEGERAAPYHAGMLPAERVDTMAGFRDGRYRVVVATSAFGMGIDQGNIGLVLHWAMPGSPEAYYQQAGRAGRDGRVARCVMLYHPGDALLLQHQLELTFPEERLVESLWRDRSLRLRTSRAVLAAADRLEAELRPGRGRVDWRRVRRRRRAALRRIEAMAEYASTKGCRRAKLIGWFGERVVRCAGCDRCGRKDG